MRYKAVFVDRDGTINCDEHYLDDPDKFKLHAGVSKGLKKLKENGFKVIVVTNQSGIGRGYFSEETLSSIHKRMEEELKKYGVVLDGIYYCPHHPGDNCECRKPMTGLFEKAIKEHNIDIKCSYMIGDRLVDVESGKNIGVKTILIAEMHMEEEILTQGSIKMHFPDYITPNFLNAVRWILKK